MRFLFSQIIEFSLFITAFMILTNVVNEYSFANELQLFARAVIMYTIKYEVDSFSFGQFPSKIILK